MISYVVVTNWVVVGIVVTGIVVVITVVTGIVVGPICVVVGCVDVTGALVEGLGIVVGANVVTGAVVELFWLVVGVGPGSLGLRKQNSLLPSKFQSLHIQFWFFWFFWPHRVPSAQASQVVLGGIMGSR